MLLSEAFGCYGLRVLGYRLKGLGFQGLGFQGFRVSGFQGLSIFWSFSVWVLCAAAFYGLLGVSSFAAGQGCHKGSSGVECA